MSKSCFNHVMIPRDTAIDIATALWLASIDLRPGGTFRAVDDAMHELADIGVPIPQLLVDDTMKARRNGP